MNPIYLSFFHQTIHSHVSPQTTTTWLVHLSVLHPLDSSITSVHTHEHSFHTSINSPPIQAPIGPSNIPPSTSAHHLQGTSIPSIKAHPHPTSNYHQFPIHLPFWLITHPLTHSTCFSTPSAHHQHLLHPPTPTLKYLSTSPPIHHPSISHLSCSLLPTMMVRQHNPLEPQTLPELMTPRCLSPTNTHTQHLHTLMSSTHPLRPTWGPASYLSPQLSFSELADVSHSSGQGRIKSRIFLLTGGSPGPQAVVLPPHLLLGQGDLRILRQLSVTRRAGWL